MVKRGETAAGAEIAGVHGGLGESQRGERAVSPDSGTPLTLDLRVYRLSAIQKAAYRLAAKFTVVLGELRGDALSVTLLFPSGSRERDVEEAVSLFFRELLDQELREKLGEETARVRTLLLAHAFSRADVPKES